MPYSKVAAQTQSATVIVSSTPASSNYGYFTVSIGPASTGELPPANFPTGNYVAWCGTRPVDGVPSLSDYWVSTNPNDISPAPAAATLKQINYVLNHKLGTIQDVQYALWALVGTDANNTIPNFSPITRSYLVQSHVPNALTMYDAAVANAPNWTSQPGDVAAVLLAAPSGFQNLILETVNCGRIGDRVWLDSGTLGIQEGKYSKIGFFLPSEPGLNGVTVNLYLLDGSGSKVYQFPSQTTAPSPANYPYLPAGTDGFYQFTGLCPGSRYQVEIPSGQQPLQGLLASPTGVNGNPSLDSNTNPTTTTLPATNPSVDQTLDFGYTPNGGNGYPVVNCPLVYAAQSNPYQGILDVTGGVSPYTYSILTNPSMPVPFGGLPAGLTLSGRQIFGYPTYDPSLVGDYSFYVSVKDSNSITVQQTCTIHVEPKPISYVCPTATADIIAGQPVTFTMPAAGSGQFGPFFLTGGSGSYALSATNTPAGMNIASDGSGITWTPAAAGTYAYTVVVWDGKDPSSTGVISNCSITAVPAAPTLSCPMTTTAPLNRLFSTNLMEAGGLAPLTYAISAGSLPPGLSLSGSTISGTPIVAGDYTFSATVTDSRGATATASNCPLSIGLSFSLGCVTGTATVGSPYTSSPTINGSVAGKLTITMTGTLPDGLTFSNGVISGTPKVSGTFTVTFTATDSGTTPATVVTQTCTIIVAPPPPVTTTCITLPNLVQSIAVPSGLKMTASGGAGMLTFSSTDLPAGMTLLSDGTFSGTPAVSGDFTYHVTAKDNYGTTTTVACNVHIAPAISTTCLTITGAVQGMPLPGGLQLSASGGVGTLTFSSPDLASFGLAVSNTGLISGTPNTNGTINYTIVVTDGNGNTGTFHCSFQASPTLTVNCLAIAGAVQGVALPAGLQVGATGGAGPVTFSSSDLANYGLAISTSGVISGTPNTSGTISYHVTVTDQYGHSVTTPSCGITIAPPPTVNCLAITGAMQGVALPAGLQVAASGGIGTLTFSSADLANYGLAISPSGVISGTPNTSGTITYHVTITDANNNTATTPGCSFTVAAPLSVNCLAIAGAVQGVALPAGLQVSASGGIGTLTFSSPDLANFGLSISATGVISGTPNTSGSIIYHVTVTDTAGHTATTTGCGITIAPPPPITGNCVAINGAIVGSLISPVQLTAAGGSGALTYSSPDLARYGLAISSTGLISGTPNVAGTISYTVVVTDAYGTTGTLNCSVVVAPRPTANCVAISAVQGNPIPATTLIPAGGLGGPYAFAATGLPTGVTLSAAGVLSGTPTQSGTFSYTVTVRDGAGNIGTYTCSITVQPPPSTTCLSISTAQGLPMTAATFTGAGGVGGPYTFSATGLPAGVLMSANGTLSGTPTVNGIFTYTVTVTDAAGNSGVTTCSMVVTGGNMCGLTWGYWKNHSWPVWPAQNGLVMGGVTYSVQELQNILATSVAGDASLNLAHQLIAALLNVYNGTNIATDGGAISAANALLATYAPRKLPLGIDPSSTAGTQMTAVASQLDFFNSDGAAQPGCMNGPSALSLVCAASTAMVGTPYSSAAVAGGGMGGPYTYAIVSGSLPPGLTLDPATGKITGTPTQAGTFTYSVRAADSSYNGSGTTGTVTSNCSIVVTALSLLCPTATGQVNEPYASVVAVSGSTGVLTFSLASGSLPAGLTLDPSMGTLKGTPTAAGSYSFSIKVTDSGTGATATTNCTIVVTPPALTVTCPAAAAQTTVAYSSPVKVTGGAAPYTFAIASGSLPAGLVLNTATGQITGNPVATGTFSFSIKVTDSANNSMTTNCAIVVTTPTGSICAGMFTTYTQGGWGADPKGNNPGMLLSKTWATVYGNAGVTIGGNYKLTFTSAAAIATFLPQGGTGKPLTASATNPANSSAGVLAGQALALQLSVDYSNKGVTPIGLGSLHLVSGKMAGMTVAQVMTIANAVLGGTTSALPAGMSVTDLVSVLDSINNNFDNGTSNNGYLKY